MSDMTPREPRREDFQANARNPFATDVAVARPAGALANAEQQRSIAEVQARMIIARSNPRDPIRCMDLILRDCTRATLAEKALYQYARGGSSITGPSIRLAEAIAQRWGNIASGIKELSRSGGYSECVAYAWDLESGYYDERQYQVRHWRDTKQGGYAITDERDIYELIANMGQRRKRAVLLTVIPGDVVEAATEQCERTLHTNADTSPEALARMVTAFEQFGVTKTQIEKRCQCRIEAVRPAQIVQLSKIFASIQDGMSDAGDWFDAPNGAWQGVDAVHAAQQSSPKGGARSKGAEGGPDRAIGQTVPGQTAGESPAPPTETPAPRGKGRPRKAADPAPTEDQIPFDRLEDDAKSPSPDSRNGPLMEDYTPRTAQEALYREEQPARGMQTAPPESTRATAGADEAVAQAGGDMPTSPPAAFSAWLVDGEGNVIPDGDGEEVEFTDPVAFAHAYKNALDNEFPGTVDLFIRANADSLAQAMVLSTQVARILSPEPVEAATADAPPLGLDLPIDPVFIPPVTKNTKAELDSYHDRLKVLLSGASTMGLVGRVMAVNAPEIDRLPPPRRLAALALAQNREKELAPPPARGAKRDAAALAESLLADLASFESSEDIDTWLAFGKVKEELDWLILAATTLYDKVMAAVNARRQYFAGTAQPRSLQEIADALIAGLNACADWDAIRAFGMVAKNEAAGKRLAAEAPEIWAKVAAVANARRPAAG